MRWMVIAAFLVHVSIAHYLHHQFSTTPPPPDIVAKPLDNFLVIDEKTGIQYNPYSKHYPGRHVCTTNKQVYCKPPYTKYRQRCKDNNQLCSGVRVVYQKDYRDLTATKQVVFVCCPGWTQVNNRSHGCNKPKCSTVCQNGGSCVKPDVCICLKGYGGRYCEIDVDECKEYKPCDQICYNMPGSYRCQCRENFILQADGQSCRKEGTETAFEAKDLEFELLDKRLQKLETMMGDTYRDEPRRRDFDKVHKNIDGLTKDISAIKNKIYDVENYKNDMYIFKNKLHQLEKKASKVDELLIKYEKFKTCAFHNKILCF